MKSATENSMSLEVNDEATIDNNENDANIVAEVESVDIATESTTTVNTVTETFATEVNSDTPTVSSDQVLNLKYRRRTKLGTLLTFKN